MWRLRAIRRCAVASVAAASLLAPRHARASDTERCLGAVEQGEQLKKRGELVASRRELAVCARDACPAPVRAMCRSYLDQVESALPTLEVTARGRGGERLAGVKILIDGEEATAAADGTIAVDPGAHAVRVEHSGAVEETIVKVAIGQKRTPVVAVFEARSSALDPATAAPPPRERSAPVLTYVLGGLGVAALGGGAVFGAKWSSDADCRPRCSPDQTERVRVDAAFTDVFVGAGLVSLGVAAVLWLASDRDAGAGSVKAHGRK